MGVEALERDGDGVGGKALVLELATTAAVERVGADGAEPRDVEAVGAAADFFVGREGDANRRRAGSPGCGTRCSAAATISATPALSSAPSSVSPDAVTMSLPICVEQCGIVASAQDDGRIVGQHQIASVVAAVDERLDVMRRAFPATCPRVR